MLSTTGETDLIGIVIWGRDLDCRWQIVHDPVVEAPSGEAPCILHGRANFHDILGFCLGERLYPVDEPELGAALLAMLVDERADEVRRGGPAI